MTTFASRSVFLLTAFLMLVFFIFPICITVREAFFSPQGGFSWDYVREVVENPLYRDGLMNSLTMGLGSTLASLLLALPLAVLAARFNFHGKAVLTALILAPLILPPFVGAIGIKAMFGQMGAVNSFLQAFGLMSKTNPVDWLGQGRMGGVILMNALHLYPIFYLNITAALANIDPAMEESAANLGCSPWRRFLKITLPLAMPGVFAGGTIVFIWSFTELGVPLVFDFTRVTSVQIFDGIKDMGGNPMPYALVMVMLVCSLFLFLLSKKLFGENNFSTSGRASTSSQLVKLTGGKSVAAAALFAFVIFLAILPHLGVFLTAVSKDWYRTAVPRDFTLQHFRDALGHNVTLPSIQNSVFYATVATVINVVLGVLIAYVVTRTKLKGRNLLDSLSMLPLAVPGLVLAFGYLAVSRPGQPLAFLAPGDSPVILLIIAYAMRRLPYIVRSASAGFAQTSVSLEEAAQNLGCTPARSLMKITMPLIAANVVAGALLAFSFAMLEVSDSLILAQRAEHFPITKAIYTLLGNLGNGEALASALGVWAMVFLGITLAGATMILGKKMGALFRV